MIRVYVHTEQDWIGEEHIPYSGLDRSWGGTRVYVLSSSISGEAWFSYPLDTNWVQVGEL